MIFVISVSKLTKTARSDEEVREAYSDSLLVRPHCRRSALAFSLAIELERSPTIRKRKNGHTVGDRVGVGDRRARRFRWRSRRSGGHTVGDRVGKRMPLLPLLSLFSTFQDTVFIIPLKNRRNQNYFVQTNAFGSVKCTCAVQGSTDFLTDFRSTDFIKSKSMPVLGSFRTG